MPDFTFDKVSRTYLKDGRPVKAETVRRWVADVLERTRGQAEAVTQKYLDKTITRAEWYLDMKGLISKSHSAIWMLAQGGRDATDAKSWGAVGVRIKSEVGYLRGFERALANDRAGTDNQILNRSGLYADALHSTFMAGIVNREKSAGVETVLRVLDPSASHCEDCPDLAGEYPIDEVPEIGDSQCGSACRCSIESVELEEAA
jgi:hypothetical protein